MWINVKGFKPILVTAFAAYTPTADAQECEITCRADVNGNLGGKYFYLWSAENAGLYVVWIDVDNGNTQPVVPEKNVTYLEADIAADASASTVATEIAATINAEAAFGCTAASEVATIVNAANGGCSLCGLIDTTQFQFNTDVKGVAATVPTDLKLFKITGKMHKSDNISAHPETTSQFDFENVSIIVSECAINYITE